jgi:hypothetical protein
VSPGARFFPAAAHACAGRGVDSHSVMADIDADRLAREVAGATPFPDGAGETVRRALADAFPGGADAQTPASLDGRDGLLVAAGDALSFARFEDDFLSVTGLGSLRGGLLTRRYHARDGGTGDGVRVGYRYAHERGTLEVEETAGRESARIFQLLQRWAAAG